MGIKYYGPSDHPAGFVGFRVSLGFGGKHLESYNSTSVAKFQDERDPYFKLQSLRAQVQLLEWEMESILYQYQRFVSTNRSNTKPERGVGVNGITAIFFQAKRANEKRVWKPGFNVSVAGQPGVRFSFEKYLYSDAWENAVRLWGSTNNILQDDIDRVLRNRPDPQQFKRLRRVMNDDGMDIPVEALRSVFREQKQKMKAEKFLTQQAHRSHHPGVEQSRKPVSPREIEANMREWFESEKRSAS